MRRSIIFVLLLCLIVACIEKLLLPDGYRMPSNKELSSSSRNSDKNRFAFFSADFNGDEYIDKAILAIDSAETELAIFVLWSMEDRDKSEWYKIESLPYSSIINTGIQKVDAGIIKYYADDRDEQKQEITLINDSIRLFYFEGPGSVFYFDNKSNQFEQVLISK
jgi:hypothetical protein